MIKFKKSNSIDKLITQYKKEKTVKLTIKFDSILTALKASGKLDKILNRG